MESPDQIAKKQVAKGIHLPRSALKALVLDWTLVTCPNLPHAMIDSCLCGLIEF